MRAVPADVSEFLRRFLFRQAAIVLDDRKGYLIEERLGPLLDREGLASWEELVARLSSGAAPLLRQRVAEALATHETSFFRDGHPFEALRDEILPALAARAAEGALGPPIHVWSAAASSGQEIYSVALLLEELAPRAEARLVASDFSSEILAKARAGIYTDLEVGRGLPPALLARHFEPRGHDWQLRARLRDRVEFRRINLAAPWPALPTMDVVLLRNVLFYFDRTTRRQILERAARVLRPGGHLLLGAREPAPADEGPFVAVRIGPTVCYRKRACASAHDR